MSDQMPGDFELAGRESGQQGLFGELWHFLRHNKKWWLLPMLVILVLFGLLILLSGSAAAPFIYTLF
jgi:hypothetical protein